MPEESQQDPGARIRLQPIEQEMQRSYIDYAMSVIVGRALPEAGDGRKPVQRRTLYTMQEGGMPSAAQFKKSARVVGGCLARYHPHGDSAIYAALARMVQDFSLRYPLVQGQGNWGSPEDEPAAMRYTECRLSKVAEELLQDIEKDTVEWADNFDGTQKEPLVLPAKFPNLLVNGSSGIAVGMATNMPPHNLGEIVDGLIVLIENPNATLSELYNPETGPIRGPDFPTGGILHGMAGVTEAYSTGRGLISLRAKAGYEEAKGDKVRIVITEIPYFVNKGTLVESIGVLVKQRRIDGVTDLRDESDREGMRIVLELKRDAIEDVVLNQLYHHTQMDSTFGIINLALVGGEPKVLGLKDLLQSHVDYRVAVVRRRTQYDLRKARQREHIVEGLLTAIDHLDDVIRIIRRARDGEDASTQLRSRYLLSEDQTKAILDMSLRKLTGLETQALRTEQDALKKTITDLEGILGSKERVLNIIKAELLELKEKYGDPRRTAILTVAEDLEVEDLIAEEDNIVTITNTGYIKRLAATSYRSQRRGRKGVTGKETKEEGFGGHLFGGRTRDYVLFFSSLGKVVKLKPYKVPLAGRYAKGKALVNLLPRLETGEKVEAMIPTREFLEDRFLVFATKKGRIKRTSLAEFQNIRVSGIRAIKLNEGDELMDVQIAQGDEETVLAPSGGNANRFPITQVRPMGRAAAGVAGMRVRAGDDLVSMSLSKSPDAELLTVLSSGYGKRSTLASYRKTRRGSKGVRTTSAKYAKGKVVTVQIVEPDEHLLVTTKAGVVIRCPVSDIGVKGRATRGVRLQRIEEGDDVGAAARAIYAWGY